MQRLAWAFLITVAFGVVAWLVRGVTISGALAGTLTAFLIYSALGWGGFITLLSVFAVTLICTRAGYQRKLRLGLAEERRGRNAGQVFANVLAAAAFAVLSLKWNILAIAAIAAMAEAAADTAQSEIGQVASRNAWLITTLRRVPPGTDGGVTVPGLVAGLVAATLTALTASIVHVLAFNLLWLAAVAGFLGTLVDSVLGATLERRGLLGNDGVNLCGTVSAGLVAALLASRILH